VYVNCLELNTAARCPAFPLGQRVYCPHECGADHLRHAALGGPSGEL